MVLILLKHGADINQPSDDGKTPLIWAATRNNVDMMQFLIENGANVQAVDNNGHNILDVSVIRSVYRASKFIYHGGHGLQLRSGEEYISVMVNKELDIELYLQFLREGKDENEVKHDMFLEKAKIEYQAWLKRDLVVDTRETWMEFWARTRDFGEAKLVPREELPDEMQPHKSIYGKVACLMNGIDPYPPKPKDTALDVETIRHHGEM